MASDDEVQVAKDALECAIRDYYTAVDPDVLITAWVLVTHKVSDELDAEGQSVVGVLTPSGQIFPLTRGLLDVALEAERGDI